MIMFILCLILFSILLWSINPVLVFLLWIGIILFSMVSVAKSQEQDKVKTNRRKDILDGKLGLTPTKSLKCPACPFEIYIDEGNNKILVANPATDYNRIIPFSNIIECSILENGAAVQSGGVGRAIVGGALAGGIGAIVGASTRNSKMVLSSLSVRIVTKDISNALCEIPILKVETERASKEAKEAIDFSQQIYATIISIIDSVNKETQTSTKPFPQQSKDLQTDPTESITSISESSKLENLHRSSSHGPLQGSSIEILQQLADLRDKGILTEAEFTAKKREILGLNSSEE